MDIKILTKKATEIFRIIKKGYSGKIRAERDWGILLGMALVLLFISAATNAVFFARVYEGEPLSENVDTNPPSRDTEGISDRLEIVENIFDRRAVEKRSAIDTPYPFVDPARN